jgi:plastocyanin
MRALRFALPLVVMVTLQSAHAEDAVIHIDNFTFNPAELTVKPGTTVTWINGDDIPHSVVASNTRFHSRALDTDEKFTMTFTDAGEVEYFCGLHPHMKGKIIVKP